MAMNVNSPILSALGYGGGFGGQQLQDQVGTETDEERKRRLRLQQMQTGAGSALGSLGGSALSGG